MAQAYENLFRAFLSGGDPMVVQLSGPITEVADFSAVRVPAERALEIDLAQVTTINSAGVREFALWSNGLQNDTIELSYCPKFFIDQVNIVRGILPARARFRSFYVAYYSSQDETEKRVLFERGKEFDWVAGKLSLRFPEVRSDRDQPMELDVVSERFFAFLSLFR